MKTFALQQFREKDAIKEKETNFKDHDIELMNEIMNGDALL